MAITIDETNSVTPASMIEFLIQGGFLLYSLYIFLLTTMFSNIPVSEFEFYLKSWYIR